MLERQRLLFTSSAQPLDFMDLTNSLHLPNPAHECSCPTVADLPVEMIGLVSSNFGRFNHPFLHTIGEKRLEWILKDWNLEYCT